MDTYTQSFVDDEGDWESLSGMDVEEPLWPEVPFLLLPADIVIHTPTIPWALAHQDAT